MIKKLLLFMRYKCVSLIKLWIGNFVRCIYSVKSGRVLFWADAYSSYGCNPRAISDYLLNNSSSQYELYWAFQNPNKFDYIDKKINIVKAGSLKHAIIVNTSEFLITNHRTNPTGIFWKKRKGQKYVMTWHGTMGVKKAEADMKRTKDEIELSKRDSDNCDLMLSDSSWYDKIIRTQLEYSGSILRKGIPRNDLYFDCQKLAEANRKVRNYYNINSSSKIVLYAPTFRKDYSFNAYFNDWNIIHDYLEEMLGGDIVIVIRYHQVMKRFNNSSLEIREGYINATGYDNMQELLCATNLLITDYSSTMFDMGLMRKPCILYASDVKQYDRGFYFDLRKLPMPMAENTVELIDVIKKFDTINYLNKVDDFFANVFKVYNEQNACASFKKWMDSNTLS